MLTLGFLFASFLIFIFGMYVGKEVQSQKTVHTAQPLRVPVVPSKTGLLARKSAAISPLRPTAASLPLAAFTPPATPSERRVSREKISPKPLTRDTTSASSASHRVPTSHSLPKKDVRKVAKKSPVEPTRASAKREKRPQPAPVRSAASSVPTRSVSSPPLPTPKRVKKSAPQSKGWSVQVQATTQQAAAEQTAKQLRRKGHTPSISKIVHEGKALYRVRIGPFAREADAKAAVSRFRRERTFAQAYPVSN